MAPGSVFCHAVFRGILRLFPKGFRDEFGPEMMETVRRAEWDERQARPFWGLFPFWSQELFSLLRSLYHVWQGHRNSEGVGSHSSKGSPSDFRRSRGPIFDLTSVGRAFRALRCRPGFSLSVVLTLAVAMGANTAVYTLADSVLLEPLPYFQADRLVGIWNTATAMDPPETRGKLSQSFFVHYQRRVRSLLSMAIYEEVGVNLSGLDRPVRIEAAQTSAGFFSTLGVTPVLGRGFLEGDDQSGSPAVVVLSHALWRDLFNLDPAVLDREVELDGVSRRVVGVMPPDFSFPSPETDVWTPLAINWAAPDPVRSAFSGFGRLREGVAISQATEELHRIAYEYPEAYGGGLTESIMEGVGFGAVATPLQDDIVGDLERVLFLLWGTVVLVLIISVANVGNLFLIHSEERSQEFGVRTALGASRGALLRQSLLESSLLSAPSVFLGGGLALGILSGIRVLGAGRLPRVEEVALDATGLLYLLGVGVLVALATGLLPHLRSGWNAIPWVAVGGARGKISLGPRGRLLRRGLAVAQVALAAVVLVGAGLMTRSYRNLIRVDPGFSPDGLMVLRLALPESKYPSPQGAGRFSQALEERISGLPGVEAAGAVSAFPLTGSGRETGYEVEDFPVPEGGIRRHHPTRSITPGYFSAMGLSVLAGRGLNPLDHESRLPNAVVSAAFVRAYWPDLDLTIALGRRLRWGSRGPWYAIVGVVENVRGASLRAAESEMVYFPAVRQPGEDVWAFRRMDLVVRGEGDYAASSLLAEIQALDPDLPIIWARTGEEILAGSMAETTNTSVLMSLAAVVALLLGAVGIYGVITYSVSLREREIGVRVALGAKAGEIGRMVLLEGFAIVGIGLGVGLACSLVFGRVFSVFVFQTQSSDGVVLGSVSLILAILALASTLKPALKAARLDPLEALRE